MWSSWLTASASSQKRIRSSHDFCIMSMSLPLTLRFVALLRCYHLLLLSCRYMYIHVHSLFISSFLAVVEFFCNSTSVICMLTFRLYFDDAVANVPTILWYPPLNGKLVGCRLLKQFSHKYICVLACVTLKRYGFWCICRLGPSRF